MGPPRRCPRPGTCKGVRFCRCHLPLIHVGQDEAAFKSHALPKAIWIIGCVRGMRKKSDGIGLMASAFVDETLFGFGTELTAAQLATVNRYRAMLGKAALTESPGRRFLDYGANKEGYWTSEHFMEQVHDVLDVFAVMMPDYQVMMQVDHSSGHAAKKEGALNTNTMNSGPGGKQANLRPSCMTAGCLGPHPAVITFRDGTVVDCKLQVGDMQEFNFPLGEGGKPAVPFFDREPDDPAQYFGKAKGMKQVLFERGWWAPDTGGARCKPMNKGDMEVALAGLPDFMAETSAFEDSLNWCGHYGLLSPKGHPELAGQGVEYCWGKAKQFYRRHNTMDNKTFKQRVIESMDTKEVLNMERVRKFARRARAYRNGYREPELAGSYLGIEKLVKRSKAHRCTLDQAYSFIMNA